MSTTPTKRPPESSRTPEDTPSVIARSIAQLACAPPESVGAFINDDDRDAAYQRLVTRLTADEPDAWSRAREDDVEERLGESLSTGEDVTLFHQYSEPYRVYRRAFSLRGWSHVTTESVFDPKYGASGAAGPRARG